MKSTYDMLGKHIRLVDTRNTDMVTDRLLGINIDKFFMPSVANVIGTDLSKYKLITNGWFACNPMHVGRDARLPVSLYTEDIPAIISPAYFMFEIINNSLLLPEYLMMWFQRTEFDRICWLKTDASVRGGLSWDDLCRMELPVPSLDKQKSVVKAYQTITDRITLNRAINDNLEQMAQSIFKSWFIDFDPFKDEKFIESELGLIPEGWKIGTLGDVSDITSGKRPLKKETEKSNDFLIPIIGASSVMGYTNSPLYSEKIIVTGRVGTHGIIQRFSSSCWPSDNTLIIKSNYYEFVYNSLKRVNFENMNRGSTQPLITQTDLKNIKLLIPEQKILSDFETLIEKLMIYKEENLIQNERLCAFRDLLLPKLMSGKIDVSQVKI